MTELGKECGRKGEALDAWESPTEKKTRCLCDQLREYTREIII